MPRERDRVAMERARRVDGAAHASQMAMVIADPLRIVFADDAFRNPTGDPAEGSRGLKPSMVA